MLFPKIDWFAKGFGKSDEPKRAYVLSFFMTLAVVSIGELSYFPYIKKVNIVSFSGLKLHCTLHFKFLSGHLCFDQLCLFPCFNDSFYRMASKFQILQQMVVIFGRNYVRWSNVSDELSGGYLHNNIHRSFVYIFETQKTR